MKDWVHTHKKDITDLSDCDFEYHDIILPSYKKGFIKYVDKIKRFRKYHPTVENLLKPGKIDFSQLFFLWSLFSEYIYDVSLGEDIIYKKKTGESKGFGFKYNPIRGSWGYLNHWSSPKHRM